MLTWLRRWIAGKARAEQALIPQVQAPLALDLRDPKTIASFDDLAARLRDQSPVCPVASGGFLLLDPADVRAAFSNTALSNQPSRFSALAAKNKGKYAAASVAANIPPFLDAPRHVEVRRWLSKAFFVRFKAFTPQIDLIAKAHAKRFEAGQSALLIEEVARAFVVDVIASFVGISLNTEQMKQYTGALFRLFAPAKDAADFEATNEGLSLARASLIQALQERRSDGAPCLLNQLDQSEVPVEPGNDRDAFIADNALLILADGVENVEAAIGQVMMHWAARAPRPATITPDFVRAIITAQTPGQTIARIAAKDMQLDGHHVFAGTPVFLSLASANAGAEPQEDFSFGMGRHKCIGEQLAVAMITSFCTALISKPVQIDAASLEYAPMFGHKWPRGVRIAPIPFSGAASGQ
ncbi:MAG: cytochrome P450 [Paracoccaceae bacterium]